MSQNRIQQQHALAYILGGNCTVVFYNTQTGKQFLYRVKRSDFKYKESINPTYYVTHYETGIYIGHIHNQLFKPKNIDTFEPIGLYKNLDKFIELSKVFDWMFRHIIISDVPEYVHILHLGTCSVCGRPLKDAESLEYGIGPICRGK